jgi:hypothetical protein
MESHMESGPEKEEREVDEKEHKKMPHHLKRENSQVLLRFREFYARCLEPGADGNFIYDQCSLLLKWLSDYPKNVAVGKDDIKANLKPAFLKDICADLHYSYYDQLQTFPLRWQLMLEIFTKLSVNPVLLKGLLHSIPVLEQEIRTDKEYNEFEGTIIGVGLKGWHMVNFDILDEYTHAFHISHCQNQQHLKRIEDLIYSFLERQELKQAVMAVKAFNLYLRFDCKALLKRLVSKEMVELAVKFIGNCKDKAHFLVGALNPIKHNTTIKDLLKKFQEINPYDFPEIIKSQTYSAMRWYVKDQGWMLSEEQVMNDKTRHPNPNGRGHVPVEAGQRGSLLSPKKRHHELLKGPQLPLQEHEGTEEGGQPAVPEGRVRTDRSVHRPEQENGRVCAAQRFQHQRERRGVRLQGR